MYGNATHLTQIQATAGKSATLILYGQTGTGKTYTLNGAIACLSKRLQRGKHETPFVFVEFMEILGPKVYDLLAKRNPIRLMAGAEGRVHAKGSSRLHVATENLLATLHEALAIRSTLTTERNPMSVMVNQ